MNSSAARAARFLCSGGTPARPAAHGAAHIQPPSDTSLRPARARLSAPRTRMVDYTTTPRRPSESLPDAHAKQRNNAAGCIHARPLNFQFSYCNIMKTDKLSWLNRDKVYQFQGLVTPACYTKSAVCYTPFVK